MDIKELRIGNYILAPRMNQTVIIPSFMAQVQGIGLFGDICICKDPHLDIPDVPIKHCAPIPLSPAILEKCGFEKNHSELIWKGCEDFFIMEYSDIHGYYYTGGEGCKLSIGFKYLHQLQNMVASITGQELQITL